MYRCGGCGGDRIVDSSPTCRVSDGPARPLARCRPDLRLRRTRIADGSKGWRVPVSFPSTLFRVGRAVVLVAVVCLASGRARAECGSHVVILNAPGTQDSSDSHAPRTTNALSDTSAPPCSGPNCSGRPERAPPIAVSHLVTTATDGTLATVAVQSRAGRGAFEREHTTATPIDRPFAIFHPPRHV